MKLTFVSLLFTSQTGELSGMDAMGEEPSILSSEVRPRPTLCVTRALLPVSSKVPVSTETAVSGAQGTSEFNTSKDSGVESGLKVSIFVASAASERVGFEGMEDEESDDLIRMKGIESCVGICSADWMKRWHE